ncbi:MAG: hypothetical protein HZA54_04740 [Planctomycetes bacterium]|nr:hypothetical protein [Planctomycetota bacterium]
MSLPSLRSGWLDELAYAAVVPGAPLIVSVCDDLSAIETAARWLTSAIPSLAGCRVIEVPAVELPMRIETEPEGAAPHAYLVTDAALGVEVDLRARWTAWDGLRDRFVAALRHGELRNHLVLFATAGRMAEIAEAAPHLLAVAQVITLSGEPIALGQEDADMVRVFRRVEAQLQAKYGMDTATLIGKVMQREPTNVLPADLARWEAVAQALREREGE